MDFDNYTDPATGQKIEKVCLLIYLPRYPPITTDYENSLRVPDYRDRGVNGQPAN